MQSQIHLFYLRFWRRRCAFLRKRKVPLFIRFLTGLVLRSASKPEQTGGAVGNANIFARGEWFWLAEKSGVMAGIEDKLPLEVGQAGEEKRDGIVMGVDKQEE